ncbi:MAG: hypothetical protein MUQ00_14465 [Candidatus Aminicenantes bacterium]|nr:hypothetical protein [Candidatus Aminicenantes bacterium]
MESLEDAMAAVYRDKTPLERLRIAFGLWSSTSIMLAGLLRSLHPDWEDAKIREEVARRLSRGTA